jgi:hypothetical protein
MNRGFQRDAVLENVISCYSLVAKLDAADPRNAATNALGDLKLPNVAGLAQRAQAVKLASDV